MRTRFAKRKLGTDAVRRVVHRISVVSKVRTDAEPNCLVVIDDEQRGRSAIRSHRPPTALAIGSRTVTPPPPFVPLAADTVPPCSRTMRWVIESPRPVPLCRRVMNGWRMISKYHTANL